MALTITAADTLFVTLDELKDHLNITSARDDAELMLTLGAATDAVEGLVGPVLHRTVVETVYPTWTGRIVLRQGPVVSVTSFLTNETPSTYTADLQSGILSDLTTTGTSVVTYVAGRAVVPDGIRLATLIIAGHLWNTQRGANSPSTGLQGEDGYEPQPGLGYAIPARALDLLAPYKLPPTVA